MTITANAADGTKHLFPDDTDPAVMDKVMKAYATQNAAPPPPAGPQPTMWDRAMGLGRGIHDNLVAPLEGLNAAAMKAMSLSTGGIVPDVSGTELAAPGEKSYQASLAANRNTPGYAAARANADKVSQGSGLGDQLTASFNPAIAGMAGLASRSPLDNSNAMADAQQAAQDTYHQAHPILSTAANLIGGLATGAPEGVLASLRSATRGAAPMLLKTPAIKPMVQQAHDAGYTLTPRMISASPGIGPDAMAGLSGKVKTAQAASEKNQAVTNTLAAKSLGLPEDTVLSDSVLSKVRKDASKAYSAVSQAMPTTAVDQPFIDTIKRLKPSEDAAFPDLMKNDEVEVLVESLTGKKAPSEFKTQEGVQIVRRLRNNANQNFKAASAAGGPDKLELAFAQRHAADAIDSLIERNLENGPPRVSNNDAGTFVSPSPDMSHLVNEYKTARQLIAKSHDVEAATNTATGNVSARKIAQLANRGRPFTGDLKTIADTAAAFPRAMQSEAAFGETEPLSVLDMATGAASAAAGHPSVLGAIMGRPIARAAVLSGPMQRSMVKTASVPQSASALRLPALNPQTPFPRGALPPLLLRTQAGQNQ